MKIARAFMRGDVSPLERSAQRFGDIAYLRFPIGAYVVSNPAWVRRVLVTHHHNYIKGSNYREMRYAMGRGLVTSDGDEWVSQRRRVGRAFYARAIRAYTATAAHHAEALVERWRARPEGAFDLAPDMVDLSCRIAGELFFGVSTARVAQNVHRWARTAGAAVVRRIYTPLDIPRWLPTPSHRAEREAVESLDRVVYGVIDTPPRNGARLTVLDLLREAAKDGGMTRRQLRDELMTLFLAGHDTVCASLLWFYDEVGRRPDVMATIAREVDEVLGDRDVVFERLAELRYTEAAFKETMRLRPAIPVIAWTPTSGARFGQHEVSAGSVVLLPITRLHRDPSTWQRPHIFDPKRFIEGEPPADSFIPFSMGPRRCIGDRLAMVEALTIIATLARYFSLPVEPGFVSRPHTTITMQPSDGPWVRRHAR